MTSRALAPKSVHRLCRRIFLVSGFAAALTVLTAGQRVAASDDPAIVYVRDLGEDVMAILGDKAKGTFAEREAAFREVMARGFDLPLVARFVLGRHWKSATKEERVEFTSILLDFLARVYALRFDSYSYGGERFTVRSAIADESGDTIVRAQVVRPSGADPVGLDFRIRWKDGHPGSSTSMSKAPLCCTRIVSSSARSSIARASADS